LTELRLFVTMSPSNQPQFQARTETDNAGRFLVLDHAQHDSIVDTGKGRRSVTNEIEAVLRKIEYWHQGSIAGFRIVYRDENGVWDGVSWDGKTAFWSR
jgi:hypothetical protein